MSECKYGLTIPQWLHSQLLEKAPMFFGRNWPLTDCVTSAVLKRSRQQELLSIPPLITHRYLPDFRLIYFRLIACVSANAPSGHKRPKYWVPPWQPHGLSGKLKIEGWYGGDTEEGQGSLGKKKIAREHERLGYLFEAWVSFWVLSSKTRQVSLTGIAAAWRAQPQPRIFTIDGFLSVILSMILARSFFHLA